jgi:DNA-binding beta-propeller fold protein YncE
MQIDPGSGKVVQELRDGRLGCPCGANLFSVDGTLWQRAGRDGNVILVRDMRSGGIQHVMDAPIGTVDGAVGFGSIWVLRSLLSMKHGTVTPLNAVQRRDELSSRVLANVRIPGDIQGGTIAAGGGAIWVLQPDGTLDRIDPATNRVTGRYASHAIETTILLPAGPYLWICECVKHEVLRYDPRSRTGKTFHFNEQPWHLVQVTRPGGSTLWLMDEAGATLTRIDPSTGRQLQPLGLNGHPTEAAQLGNSIWVAAGDVVDRIRLPGGVRTSYPLPKGVNATGIASDAATGRIWVLNSFRPPPS